MGTTEGRAAGQSVQASCVFLSIEGLLAMDGPTAHTAMGGLHRVLHQALVAPGAVPGIRVLSSLTGAIIMVPDDASCEVVGLFAGLAPAITKAGIAVRAGIAHGHVELLEDADGTLNAIGPCINVAARLAFSAENSGLLVHESYADLAKAVLRADHWLHPVRRSGVDVPGKRDELFRCFVPPGDAVDVLASCEGLSGDPAPGFVHAVLLAYDLPSFSEGDARQIASRFRSVVQEVRRMRDVGAIPRDARFSFSPGGDGAVLSLANVHAALAHEMAEKLERLLDVETSLKAEGAGVRARIGVHYGPVLFYENAEGASRPTGSTLFDADALAGDDEAKKHDAVIVSGALIDLAAHGSSSYRKREFQEIGPLARTHGVEIRRFVRRRTRALVGPPETERRRPEHIEIGRLPVPGKYLFGRDQELARLDAAWADQRVHVISIIAMGGAGKTALVDRWLKNMEKDGWRGAERVYGWSFYSQGSSNTASADTFIDAALRWFGDADPKAGSPWDKGERLARLVKQHRTLLVLDGVEPLQAPPGQGEGKIRDPGLAALVRELAAGGRGLCVMSSRLAVDDLASREDGAAPKIDLDRLEPGDGARLLEALGVKGANEELRQAARELRGHALALTLLGGYLRDACGGDIRRRGEIGPLEGDATKGEHARRVMEAYARWLGDGAEVAVLRVLGLFDRPADAGCIQALREPPAIPGLTDKLIGMEDRRWNQTLAKLRRTQLVSEAFVAEPGTIDAHPLVREHFGARLREQSTEAWRAGHGRLFEHLQQAAPEFPETTEDMAPLYAAVVHGCHAGRGQEALDGVFWRRVERSRGGFNTHVLGAFGAQLGMMAAFFDPPWAQLAGGLTEDDQVFVLNESGFALRSVGRLDDAANLSRLALDGALARQDHAVTATAASNLSEIQLARGAVREATEVARRAVEYADRSADEFHRSSKRARLADALHAAGRLDEARVLFDEAEAIQRTAEPAYPLLYSLSGFQYCHLLLALREYEEVIERATKTLAWVSPQRWLLSMAWDRLSIGRARMLLAVRDATGHAAAAGDDLGEAVMGFRKAGAQHHLPRGLLARAELHVHTGDFPVAERDLDEALSIAVRGSMRLHETDAHLGFARLHLARGERDKARASLATAKALIERTGYQCRDAEAEALESQLA